MSWPWKPKRTTVRSIFTFRLAILSILKPFPFLTEALPSYNSYQKPRNITNEEERGVHGGEYSVRPNMQESMVFLRKLFSHQKQVRGNVSFSNLMSPPDSPLRTSVFYFLIHNCI